MGLCQSSIDTKTLKMIIECERNERDMVKQLQDKLVAQIIINEQAIECVTEVQNLGKKVGEHLDNMALDKVITHKM